MGIKSESYKRKIHTQLYIWEWIREAIEDLRIGKKIYIKGNVLLSYFLCYYHIIRVYIKKKYFVCLILRFIMNVLYLFMMILFET